MADDVLQFDIQRDGRAWRGREEIDVRWEAMGEWKWEVFDGRLPWPPEVLRAVLGALLEQAGADVAVSLGNVDVWRAAVDARERDQSV